MVGIYGISIPHIMWFYYFAISPPVLGTKTVYINLLSVCYQAPFPRDSYTDLSFFNLTKAAPKRSVASLWNALLLVGFIVLTFVDC